MKKKMCFILSEWLDIISSSEFISSAFSNIFNGISSSDFSENKFTIQVFKYSFLGDEGIDDTFTS